MVLMGIQMKESRFQLRIKILIVIAILKKLNLNTNQKNFQK